MAGLGSGQATPAAPPEPARSTVFVSSSSSAVAGYEEMPGVTRRMTEQLVLAATKKPDARTAWQSLIGPKDVVGIKVATAGGRILSSHRGIVEAIAAGLEQAGVPRSRIIVWDRSTASLRAAGFIARRNGYAVRGIDPPRGLDREAKFFAPVFGRLMWGDLGFPVKTNLRDLKQTSDALLSAESYLPLLLTREVTKIVNVAVLSDEPGCGIAGALYNVTVPSVDNARRFTQGDGASAICDLYLDERIGPRVVLNFVDGLVAQYAAGPEWNPNYAHAHHAIYASKDPVALDSVILGKLEEWRKMAKLPPIGKRAAWLGTAEELGLGHHDPAWIDVKNVPLAP